MSYSKSPPLNENLNQYFEFYLQNHAYQHAILINGKWGSGKTYYIKEKIKPLSNKKITSSTGIILNPIYVSLYGLSDIQEINSKIKEFLSPILHSKTAKTIKKALLDSVKVATNISFDANGEQKSDGKLSFNINSIGLLKNRKIKGNKILIFDDLERCNINLSSLFGYINEFIEHHNCKVILLADEEKLIAKNDSKNIAYKNFKEKLIGQTFTLQADVNSTLGALMKNLDAPEIKEIIAQKEDLIKNIFLTSKIQNLRILKQGIIDFKRFLIQIDIEYKKNNQYHNFLNDLFIHFLIIYLEYKSGNKDITKVKLKITRELSLDMKDIESKYASLLSHYNVRHNSNVLGYEYIIDFVKNGYSERTTLNKAIKLNSFFRDMERQDWEKLWFWQSPPLEERDFERLYQSVHNDFLYSKFSDPYSLTHAATILLSLNNHGLKKLDSKGIINTYKSQIDTLLILNMQKKNLLSLPGEYAWGKEYQGKDTPEYNQILEFFKKKIITHNNSLNDDHLKKVFENINDNNIINLKSNLHKPTLDRSDLYVDRPLLVTVEGNTLSNKLLQLTNKNLDFFFHYMLKSRFIRNDFHLTGYLPPFDPEEIKCLENLLLGLKKALSIAKPIKMFLLKKYIPVIEDIISSLK